MFAKREGVKFLKASASKKGYLTPEEILFERRVPKLPGAAEKFMAALP